jgi:hypothetical protein
MKIDEVNDMIYYLAEKYEFNPLKCKINLLTGIVTPKDLDYNLDSEIMGFDSYDGEREVEEHQERESTPSGDDERFVEEYPRRVVEIEDSVDGIRTYRIYAEEIKAEYMAAEKVGGEVAVQESPEESLKQLDAWINRNQLTYLEARKMVSSLGLKRKIKEVAPGSADVMDSVLLNEFDEWMRRRRLNYFNVRMMIARLGQDEERARMEKAIAR